MISFTIPACVADALDRFYSRQPSGTYRGIRRDGEQVKGAPQLMVTTQFAFDVIMSHAEAGETIAETILRLANTETDL